MNLRNLSLIIILTCTAACAPVRDGALGRFHRYDTTEYRQTVEILHSVQKIDQYCSSPDTLSQELQRLDDRVTFFKIYAEGRPYNSRTVSLVSDLQSLVTDTRARTQMSEFFCQERIRNIVRAAEILRSASGEKPE